MFENLGIYISFLKYHVVYVLDYLELHPLVKQMLPKLDYPLGS